MTVEEFYAAVGGDYEGVLGRLRSEERLRKFAVKFDLRESDFLFSDFD